MSNTSILFVCGPVWSYIEADLSKISGGGLLAVNSVLRARPTGYKHTPQYKAGHWDGYISLKQRNGHFPTGLVPAAATEEGEDE